MKHLLLSFLFLSALLAQDKQIKELFEKYNINGTIVVQSLDTSTTYTYNSKRANTRLLPASTFKIPHTLIALNENIIKDQKQIIKWDGKKRFLDVWNQDQTIDSAFKFSCVWCYQYIASKLSIETYDTYLKKLSYGNEQTGKVLINFWLEGDIRISPVEQIGFLRQLHLNQLPFKLQHINLLKNMMIEEQTHSYTLRAKTGFVTAAKPKHGWYIGYVQTKDDVWFFATNLLLEDFKKLFLRKQLTLDVLKLKGIL